MTYEEKYTKLIKIDTTGTAQKLYDIYVALSFLQNNLRVVKADDFSVACLLGTSIKIVQEFKYLLYQNGYINFNTEEKILVMKENNIISDYSLVEILKDNLEAEYEFRSGSLRQEDGLRNNDFGTVSQSKKKPSRSRLKFKS
ncbi:MAG: hypothetical protein KF721_15075, partial [Ignavibacteriaceae bacterium]|nr:hypothetical protein [Ignavibacteriaceae bacterium]